MLALFNFYSTIGAMTMGPKFFYFLVIVLFLTACGGSEQENRGENDEYFVGVARSADPIYLPLDVKFNSWGTTTIGQERTEIMLQVKKILEYTEPGIWAFAVRTAPNPQGMVSAESMSVKLFENYSRDQDKCCVNTLPFDAFDVADAAYVAINGYINFESSKTAMFDLDFQRETSVGSSQLHGQIVNVKGCWRLAGERETSGCSIE